MAAAMVVTGATLFVLRLVPEPAQRIDRSLDEASRPDSPD